LAQVGFLQKLTWIPSICGGILASEDGAVGSTGAGAAAPEISAEIKMPYKLLNLQGILVNHHLFFNRLSNPIAL